MKELSGKKKSDIRKGFFAFRTTTLTSRKKRPAISAAIRGVTNHASTIETTPPGKGEPAVGEAVQTIESGPAAMRDIPMIAPTIECVVETGSCAGRGRGGQRRRGLATGAASGGGRAAATHLEQRRDEEPDPGREQRAEHAVHEQVGARLVRRGVGDARADRGRDARAEEQRAAHLAYRGDGDRLAQRQRARADGGAEGIGDIVGACGGGRGREGERGIDGAPRDRGGGASAHRCHRQRRTRGRTRRPRSTYIPCRPSWREDRRERTGASARGRARAG